MRGRASALSLLANEIGDSRRVCRHDCSVRQVFWQKKTVPGLECERLIFAFQRHGTRKNPEALIAMVLVIGVLGTGNIVPFEDFVALLMETRFRLLFGGGSGFFPPKDRERVCGHVRG